MSFSDLSAPKNQTPGSPGIIRPLRGLLLALSKQTLLLTALLTALLALLLVLPQQGLAQEKFSGTYRIEGWEALEKQALRHFFYLHPEGVFLLAAEWPGNETSRIVGNWSVAGTRMSLAGKGEVKTNQGNWTVTYLRTFDILVTERGFRLKPIPEKNRFGLMGWPNQFVFYRPRPDVNLEQAEFPEDESQLLAWIKARMAAK